MIEINLSSNKGSANKLNVGGIDLTQLNVKMVIFSILFLFIPEGILVSYYDQEIASLTSKEQTLRSEVRKVSSKVRSLANIKKQLQALKDQEEALSKRLNAVKLVINQKNNPFKLLYYVAQNTPKTVWLTSMNMKGKQLTLNGHAENWRDIGIFLESLKNSIFLNNLEYKVPEGSRNTYDGRKVEVFQITATVVRFE